MCVAGALSAPALLAAPATAEAGEVTTTPVARAKAAAAAERAVGLPYVYGAAGPRSFDCSGLVAFAYRVAGVKLGVRTTFDMWNIGTRVRRSGMKRGDIIFAWDRAHGHVGMYLGKGRYVHAPGTGRRVQIAPVPPGSGWVGAVRP